MYVHICITITGNLLIHQNSKVFICGWFVSARGTVVGMCVLYVCSLAPHGIPNISIPVDAFDVFEAT